MEDGFVKENVQKFGKFLSAMVMPNIGTLIAFGFLAALFIDTGWIPNKGFNSLVSPMLTYLIPILIASTGGRMIGGDRGRVVGAIAVIGAIMSNTSITMLMAAMVMGPLAGFCIKKSSTGIDLYRACQSIVPEQCDQPWYIHADCNRAGC